MSPRAVGSSLFLNDHDVGIYGLSFPPPQGWMDGPQQSDSLTAIPGLAGGALMTDDAALTPRTVVLTGVFMALDETEALAVWDELNRILGTRLLEVRFAKQPDRMAYGRYRGLTWNQQGGWRRGSPCALTLEMPNAYKVGRSFDVYAIASGTQSAIALGSAPCHVTLNVVGTGGASPGVRYRDAQGMIRGEFSFDLTLPAQAWIDYDGGFHLGALYAYNGTVPPTMIPATVTDQPPVLTRQFVLNPTDGDGTNGPTLEAVNCSVTAFVRRAWR